MFLFNPYFFAYGLPWHALFKDGSDCSFVAVRKAYLSKDVFFAGVVNHFLADDLFGFFLAVYPFDYYYHLVVAGPFYASSEAIDCSFHFGLCSGLDYGLKILRFAR